MNIEIDEVVATDISDDALELASCDVQQGGCQMPYYRSH